MEYVLPLGLRRICLAKDNVTFLDYTQNNDNIHDADDKMH